MSFATSGPDRHSTSSPAPSALPACKATPQYPATEHLSVYHSATSLLVFPAKAKRSIGPPGTVERFTVPCQACLKVKWQLISSVLHRPLEEVVALVGHEVLQQAPVKWIIAVLALGKSRLRDCRLCEGWTDRPASHAPLVPAAEQPDMLYWRHPEQLQTAQPNLFRRLAWACFTSCEGKKQNTYEKASICIGQGSQSLRFLAVLEPADSLKTKRICSFQTPSIGMHACINACSIKYNMYTSQNHLRKLMILKCPASTIPLRGGVLCLHFVHSQLSAEGLQNQVHQ